MDKNKESATVSRTGSIPFNHTWTIKNFKKTLENEKFDEYTKIYSEQFDGGDFKWDLVIEVSKDNNFKMTGLFLYFRSHLYNNKKVKVNWTISLLDKNGNLLKSDEFSKTFEDNGQLENRSCGYPEGIPADLFQNAVGEDLVVKLEAWIEHGYILLEKEKKSDNLAEEIANKNALIDFSSLKEDEEFADFRIIVGNRVFKSHKIILAARSLYFRAMFNSKMTEYQTGEVKIEGHSEAAVEAMIHFIYCGNIKNVSKSYEGLRAIFIIADQYLLEDLKDLAEEQIVSLINLENATIIYSDTVYMNCKKVNEFLREFLADNFADLKNFETLARKRPSLFQHIWALKLKRRKIENSDENPEDEEISPDGDEDIEEDEEEKDDNEENESETAPEE